MEGSSASSSSCTLKLYLCSETIIIETRIKNRGCGSIIHISACRQSVEVFQWSKCWCTRFLGVVDPWPREKKVQEIGNVSVYRQYESGIARDNPAVWVYCVPNNYLENPRLSCCLVLLPDWEFPGLKSQYSVSPRPIVSQDVLETSQAVLLPGTPSVPVPGSSRTLWDIFPGCPVSWYSVSPSPRLI